jgi:hypothetical protein
LYALLVTLHHLLEEGLGIIARGNRRTGILVDHCEQFRNMIGDPARPGEGCDQPGFVAGDGEFTERPGAPADDDESYAPFRARPETGRRRPTQPQGGPELNIPRKDWPGLPADVERIFSFRC